MPTHDRFPVDSGSIGPGTIIDKSYVIDPSAADVHLDAADKGITRAIYVGGAGDLVFIHADDETDTPITWPLIAGYHPIRAKQVNQTGTTATGIRGIP